jgi:Putative Ig domain
MRNLVTRLLASLAAASSLVMVSTLAVAPPAQAGTFTITAVTNSPVPYGQLIVVSGAMTPIGYNTNMELQELQPGGRWLMVGDGWLTDAGTYTATASCAPGTYFMRVGRMPVYQNETWAYSPIFTVTCKPFVAIVLPTRPVGLVLGVSYNVRLGVSGGLAPYTWYAWDLPPGLHLTTAGVLKGIPSAAGSYQATLLVVDAAGHDAAEVRTFTVSQPPPV